MAEITSTLKGDHVVAQKLPRFIPYTVYGLYCNLGLALMYVLLWRTPLKKCKGSVSLNKSHNTLEDGLCSNYGNSSNAIRHEVQLRIVYCYNISLNNDNVDT